MSRSPEQATAWVADKIKEVSYVKGVTMLTPFSFRVERVTKNGESSFVAGVISCRKVDVQEVKEALNVDSTIEILINIPKESSWTGGAVMCAQMNEVAFGGIGDLMSAISAENVREYIPKDLGFVERGLRQHDRVEGFLRKSDRLYEVNRHGLPSLKVAVLKEYELSADHVREARDRYGRFDIILISNPNGRATTSAKRVGESIGVEILKWGELMGRLNKNAPK